jgi:hypothetical protein
MRPRIARSVVTVPPRPREGMSKQHASDIAKLPCIACGSVRNVHCHHLLRTGEHGMARRSADSWGIPMCRRCHDPREAGSLHHNGDEEAWLAARKIDGRGLARSLWEKRGDLAAMFRIVARSLNARGVYLA